MADRLIGEAYISLVPDASLFRAGADAKLKQAIAGLQGRIRITGDTTDVDAKVAALAAALKGLKNTAVSLDTRGSLVDVNNLAAALTKLRERAGEIPLDMDDSKGLSKLFNMMAGIDALSKQAQDMSADFNIERALAKFYALEAGVKALDDAAGNMRADFDETAANEKILELAGGVNRIAENLSAMRASVTDSDALSKIVALQAQALKLAGTLKNLPVTADTLPFESSLFKLSAQVEKLGKTGNNDPLSSVGVATAAAALEGMSERLTGLDKYLKATGEIGSRSFEALSQAIADAGKELGRISGEGANAGNVTQIRNLDVAIKQLGADTGLTAAQANRAYQGFGLFGRAIAAIKNTSIPLFGGALEGIAPKFLADASGIHLLIEGVVEFVAVWGPALLALTAFSALAYKTGKEVFNQFTMMNTVVEATGAKFNGLKGTVQGWEKAIQPQVLQLFGDYLTLAGNNAGHFSGVMQSVGRVLDDFGARLAIYLNSQTTSKFLDKAASDIQGLGIAFTEVGRIIKTLLAAVPGYAEMLLKLGDAFLTVTANIVQFAEPAIAWFLKFHGAEFYIGLAATAVIAFGKALSAVAIAKVLGNSAEALTGFAASAANWANDFTSDNEKVAEAAGATGSKVQKLGGIMGGIIGTVANVGIAIGAAVFAFAKYSGAIISLAASEGILATAQLVLEDSMAAFGRAWVALTALISPEVLVFAGVAAILGGALFLAFQHVTDAAAGFNKQMQQIVINSNIANVQQNIAGAITATSAALAKQQALLDSTANSYRTLGANGRYNPNATPLNTNLAQANELRQGLSKLVGESDTAGIRTQSLIDTYGTLGNAMGIVTLSGVKQSDVATANAQAWALDEQKIKATAAAYGFMGTQAGAAGAQLNALSIQEGTNYKAVQALVQAEASWISLITGGDASFDTYEQGFSELTSAMSKNAKAGATLTVSIGGLKDKFTAFGGVMDGTSQSSLALRQAFDSQLSAATTLYGSLQTLTAASGNTKTAQNELAKSGKDIIAQLLPFAAGSKQATAELSGLAQLMGGPATDNFATLAKWVGNVKGAEADLNDQQAKLTISSNNLSTAAKNLGNALQTMVTQDEAAAIAKTANLAGATQGLASAASQAKDQVTQQAVAMSGEYITALEKTGIKQDQATQYLNAYLRQLGYQPAAIAAIDSQMGDSIGAWQKYDAAVVQNTNAAKAFQVASEGNRNSLAALSGLLPMTAGQYTALWTAITKQDQAMVASGKDATGAKAEFVNFANDGLHVTTAQADALWKKFGQQNLDTLAAKAGATKGSFIQFAENGLHLTTAQAQLLWSEFASQNLDMLVSKGNTAKSAFIQLAKNGLDLTTNEAMTLWNTLRDQYLDTLANKAGETKNAFIQTAKQFGITAGAAQELWNKLHQIPANVHTNVSETISGSGEIKAAITASSLTLTSAGFSQQQNEANTLAPGKALGGVIHGGIHGQDSVHTMLAPGELVIPSSHAAAHMVQAKREGVPGMAAGGVIGSPSAAVANVQKGISTAQSGQVSMTAAAMKSWVGMLSGAFQQAALGGVGGISGNVKSYEADVIKVMGMLGIPIADLGAIMAQMATESGGNPTIVNHSDSNAAAGHPSTGLMQVIAGTFDAYAGPYRNIGPFENGVSVNPMANIFAGLNYAIHAYGLKNLPNVLGHGHGYARGGLVMPKSMAGSGIKPFSTGGAITEPVYGIGQRTGTPYSFAENGQTEYVSNAGQMAAASNTGMPGMTTYQGMNLINLIQTLVKQNQRFPQAIGGAIGNAGGNGVHHGYWGAQG